ncbi:MAG TPA: hypothetical protein VFU17_16000, partial [Candidatus Limnocylindrales bacterium]|nr:hypothetical protein [Candidatus Limnocylindrales bacterium]
MTPDSADNRYKRLHAEGLARVEPELLARLRHRSPQAFKELWPPLLETLHVTKTEVAQKAWELVRTNILAARGLKPRERSIKDAHVLSLGGKVSSDGDASRT